MKNGWVLAGLLMLSGCAVSTAAPMTGKAPLASVPTPAATAPTASTSATGAPTATVTATPTAAAKSTAPAAPAAASKPPAATPKPTPTPTAVNCEVAKCVALTYDDGPSDNTYDLLDKLEAAQAPATFFYIGNQIENYSDTIKRATKDGIVIGNHTWTHPYLTQLSAAGQAKEVDRTSEEIQLAGGPKVTLLRPPFGDFDSATKDLGYPLIMWDVDTLDWSTHSGTQSLETIQEQVQPGSIILMHDFETSSTAETPIIVKWLRSKGYTLVTVPQLLGHATPGRVYDTGPSGA